MFQRNNDYYFYLGGIVSFTTFFLIGLTFLLFILEGTRVKHIQISSSNYISVNLDTVAIAEPKKVNESKKEKEEDESIKKPLETIEVPKEVDTDISSLFGEVQTKELVKRNKTKKSQVDDKFLKKITKRIETKDTKVVKADEASSVVKNLKLSKQEIKVVGDSSGVVDEYLAKIHSEIYSKFFPPSDSGGKTAKVRLEIDAYGVLVSFRVIRSTGDTLFDEAVDSCLNSIHQFPIHPDKKKMSLEIILTAKE